MYSGSDLLRKYSILILTPSPCMPSPPWRCDHLLGLYTGAKAFLFAFLPATKLYQHFVRKDEPLSASEWNMASRILRAKSFSTVSELASIPLPIALSLIDRMEQPTRSQIDRIAEAPPNVHTSDSRHAISGRSHPRRAARNPDLEFGRPQPRVATSLPSLGVLR